MTAERQPMTLQQFFDWLNEPDIDEAELTAMEKLRRDINKSAVEQTIRMKVAEQAPKQFVKRIQTKVDSVPGQEMGLRPGAGSSLPLVDSRFMFSPRLTGRMGVTIDALEETPEIVGIQLMHHINACGPAPEGYETDGTVEIVFNCTTRPIHDS